ncbi:MAG: hypothetical protein AMXMBFR84_51030 [Candidatus Hydrogenedentota bacterium]
MPRYNVNQAWVDPYDTPANRREADRFPVRAKLSMTVENQSIRQTLVGPGIIENLSRTGVLVKTRHKLRAGQRISIAFPTARFRGDIVFPEAFMGTAEVVRSTPLGDGVVSAALSFGDAFTNNMEFVLFVEFLQRATETLAE